MTAAGTSTPARSTVKASDSSEDDAPLVRSARKAEHDSSSDSLGGSSDDEEQDEVDSDNNDDGDDDDDEDGDHKSRKPVFSAARGAQKWETLYHTGPRFPPDYEPLPPHVKLLYNGQPVDLPPQSEEAAMFYAVKLETQHAQNPIFNNNFFGDFAKYLAKFPPRGASAGIKITDFSKLDFRPMYTHWKQLKDAEAERKKLLAPSQRKKELAERKAAEEAIKTCIVDGQVQRVGNVLVEPPALFLGRGAHPKTGLVKKRVQPEQITINHTLGDSKHPPPAPPAGHKWKNVIEDKNATWLAFWNENINGSHKYMFLDATSTFKTGSDKAKYEKAQKLDQSVKKLRANYTSMLSSKSRKERQIATVIWLIDVYSLRVGNEKKEDEADTYGACSLLCEHCTLIEPNIVKLSFLGKDSMKFDDELICTDQVFRNFKMFSRSHAKDKKSGGIALKKKDDPIFEVVDPSDINKWLQRGGNGGMPGLSAKVFRTYNASTTFQALLDKTAEWLAARPNPDERVWNPANLKLAYNEANRQVAILCNHQKTVNAQAHSKTLQRSDERTFALRYDRHKELQKLKTAGPISELKKQYTPKEHDWAKHWKVIAEDVKLTNAEIQEHEERLAEEKKNRLRTRYERDMREREYLAKQAKKGNAVKAEDSDEEDKPLKRRKTSRTDEKPAAAKARKPAAKQEDGDDELALGGATLKFKSKEQLNEELAKVDAHLAELAQERKTGKSLAKAINVPVCCRRILSKVEGMKKVAAERANKENTKEVSLGTSKLNYIDPRCTVAWLKHWDQKLQEAGQGKSQTTKKRGANGRATDDKVKKEKNGSGAGDKMELDLKVMSLGMFFPMTMQKKFKWAAEDDAGKPLPPNWQFVSKPESKMRVMNSAQKKQIEEGDDAPAMGTNVKASSTANGNGTAKPRTKSDTKTKPNTRTKPAAKVVTKPEDSDDDDEPLGQQLKREDEDEDSDSAPLGTSTKRSRSLPGRVKDEEGAPQSKRRRA